LAREFNKAVGLATHRRYDNHQLIARTLPVRNAPRDVLDTLVAGDGCAAVFLND
jgi:hypothetical protein